MNAKRLADIHRALRHRLRLTQQEVAEAAGINRSKVSQIENRMFAHIRVPELERSFGALDAVLNLTVDWRGAGIDRLLDEGHAFLVGRVVDVLRSFGWQCEIEVTFAEFGDRGSIDILAWHAATRALLVVEIKTEIGSMDGLLRPLDLKVRWAPKVARERFGWRPLSVGRVVVLPEHRTARRTVERQSAVLRVALPASSRVIRGWLREPIGALSGLWFLSSAKTVNTTKNPSSIRRIRHRKVGPT